MSPLESPRTPRPRPSTTANPSTTPTPSTTLTGDDDRLRQVLVPTVIEEGNRGDRAFDIYSQLLRERIVFLGQEVDDQVANLIISQMLFLEAQHSERDIYLYINSPGGVAYAGMAIYDVMQHVEPDVSTICVGMGMSAAAMILSGGAPGKRFALPNARIMIHQGSAGTRGAPSDMEIQLREVLSLTHRMAEIIAFHTGKPVEQVARDIERDRFMSSAEAQDYGIIDDIITPRRGLCAPDAVTGAAREAELQVARA
jgi:ATP-dependent Clp protease protease subunit